MTYIYKPMWFYSLTCYNFRDVSMKNYDFDPALDPAHYISAPSLARNAMLKFTEVEVDMY